MTRNSDLRLALAASIGLGAALLLAAPNPASAAPPPAGLVSAPDASPVVKVKKWKGPRGRYWAKPKNWKPGRYHYGPRGAYVRPWRGRPYYGRVIGGVALGTILGVAIAGSVPRAPSSDLCWYWTNPSRTQGYWDYCY